MVTLGDIIRAGHRLAPYLPPTPLEDAPALGDNIWLKLENANKTHSFKIRGALNAILSLSEQARDRGIIAASSGNHAGAVAYAAHLTGASAQILMPRTTPKKKVDNVKRYGADAVLFGDTYDEAEARSPAPRLVEGGTWISPYNDAQVIAGAGTIGVEILQQLPDVQRVIAPVSGGGLIAGVAIAGQGTQSGDRSHRRQCPVSAGYVQRLPRREACRRSGIRWPMPSPATLKPARSPCRFASVISMICCWSPRRR